MAKALHLAGRPGKPEQRHNIGGALGAAHGANWQKLEGVERLGRLGSRGDY